MKTIFSIFFLLGVYITPLFAAHIRGGELYYKYLGAGSVSGTSKYLVTLKLYIDCGQNSEGQRERQVPITIFSKQDNRQFGNVYTANIVREQRISYDPNSNPCLTNPPLDVCYDLRYFETTIELPDSPSGYTLAFQRCCRIESIENMTSPSDDYGATYLCEIPGTLALPDAMKNSSPLFNTNDAVAVCMGSVFEFDFSAVDPDGDVLVYKLCDAYSGGGPSNGNACLTCPTPNPAAAPPYRAIPYRSPFTGANPLGNNITINPATGLITGVAPNTLGQFVVTTCVDEYRRGVLINTHRKDIHIKVSDCNPLKAQLNPDYSYCDDFLVTFRNQQINPTGSVYTWYFGDGAVQESDVPDGTIQHRYAVAGTYEVKLKVVLAGQCVDSTSTLAKVYPGFYPGFQPDGSCRFSPFFFSDITRGDYGPAVLWRWDFGDETTQADTSHVKNPQWLYNSLGAKPVTLIVETDKGCRDTIINTVQVKDKPDLILPFTDTLICWIDTLPLIAEGRGSFTWTPNNPETLLYGTTPNPIVFPKQTTTYRVTLTDQQCVATGDIRVRVVDTVTLFAGKDTTICATDSIQFSPVSDGLRYSWTGPPSSILINPLDKNAIAVPTGLTAYQVVATIGKCNTTDDIAVSIIPYPIANAGADTAICYMDTALLHGSIVGSSFRWAPLNNLLNANTLDPSAFPLSARTYSLYAYDTLGCPKAGIDQVLVTVRDRIIPIAGNDTAVVKGQPLQLNGSGSDFFEWTPSTYLNLASINNPVAVLDNNMQYVMRAYTQEGCFALDTINIKVFQTQPDIFVPNAFVPNSQNNLLKPYPVGISELNYFRVFNRWGQRVFETKQIGHGWDGKINGILQNSGSYVWILNAKDYTGKQVTRKGTATLIR